MSDLNRKQLQPLYDYCRSVLPQFALAIRDADDEIERLQAKVDELERSGVAIAMYSQSLGAVDRVNFERGIEKALAAI